MNTLTLSVKICLSILPILHVALSTPEVQQLLGVASEYFQTRITKADEQLALQVDHMEAQQESLMIISSNAPNPPTYGEIEERRRTNFRVMILRKLREDCHPDEWQNCPEHRRVIKRKVIQIMKINNPDIRDIDTFCNADIIVEFFFIPTDMDKRCRRLRYSNYAIQSRREYDRRIWVGTLWRLLSGQPLWVDPRELFTL